MTALPLLLVALKGAVVLLLAAFATLLLRRAPASARHGVWAAAFCGLLLLPVLEAVGPAWTVSVLPASGPALALAPPAPPTPPLPPAPPTPPAVVAFGPAQAHGFEAEMASFEAEMGAFEAEIGAFEAEMASFAAEAEALAADRALRDAETALAVLATPRPDRAMPLAGWAIGLWAFGAVVVALGWLGAFVSARRLVRSAPPETDEEWAVLAERARRLTGLPEPVQLLRSDHLDVPIAWGYGRQAVVLPASADTWTTDRREAVLLHEMAHLRRHDAWTQVLAQAAVALHWVNPLVWVGYRRFLDAREQACDDAVLQGGARPSAYAEHLVGVARNLRRDRFALAAVAPMARRVPLEGRVLSILDASRRRSRLGGPALSGTIGIALLVLVPLAAFRPVAAAQDVAPEAPVEVERAVKASVVADLDVVGAEAVAAEAGEHDPVETGPPDIAAGIAVALAEVEITPAVDVEDFDFDIDLDDLGIDLDEMDLDLSDIEEGLEVDLERSLDDLRKVEVGLNQFRLHVDANHDDDACPDAARVALKHVGLSDETRSRITQALATMGVDGADARVVVAEAEAQARSAVLTSTIPLRAVELDAQRAAAEARRAAVRRAQRVAAPRPSAPPGVFVRSAPRREASRTWQRSASEFDWAAVDRARRDALRRHSAS